MNYYEHHIGDYIRDAAHLSLLEEGAYRRLLDSYYAREAPLPGDVGECQKLARALTRPEKAAVVYVLSTFFKREKDGYHQKRVDHEIGRFQAKSRTAKASARTRWQPSAGNANASIPHMPNGCEGNADAMRTHSERIANAVPTLSEGNALQSPVTSHQTPDTRSKTSEPISQHPPTSGLLAPIRAAEPPEKASVGGVGKLKRAGPDTVPTLAPLRAERRTTQDELEREEAARAHE